MSVSGDGACSDTLFTAEASVSHFVSIRCINASLEYIYASHEHCSVHPLGSLLDCERRTHFHSSSGNRKTSRLTQPNDKIIYAVLILNIPL